MGTIRDVLGLDKKVDPSDDGRSEGDVDLSAIKASLGKGQRSGTSRRKQTVDDLALQAEINQLYQSENWEEISALYFNARFAITGWEGFQLSDAQRKILSSTLASTMRTLVRIDPAYVAMIVFCINFGGFITDKELRYRSMQAKKQEQER